MRLLHTFYTFVTTDPGKVTAVYASDRYSSVASMRDALIDALKSDDTRIMMNYLRKEYNGGHWSPIGAYNADKDMFLVVDVERCAWLCLKSTRESS